MAKTPRPAKSPGTSGGTPDPDEMDPAQQALFREVEEDLRAEQLQKLWKRFGPYIIGAAVLVVGIVAGFQGWTAYQASVRADEAQRYFDAVVNAEAGVAGLDALAREGATGYATLARLTQANTLADSGEASAAIDAYDALASDGGVPKAVRDLAGVLAAMLAMDIEDAATVRGRLTPLSADDSPWRYLARELLGVLDMRAGDTSAARAAFSDLAGAREAPPGVRSRATEYLTMLGNADGEG